MKHTILFVLGFVCLSWGGASLYIEQSADFVSVLLIVLGLVFLGFSFKRSGQSQAPQQSLSMQWKKRGLLACFVLLGAAFTVAVNYLAFSLPHRWDVTQANQHTLQNSTLEYMSRLTSEVTLTAFYVGLPPKYLVDQLNEYKRVANGKIITEIIDPIAQIGYAAQFGNTISGKERKLIVRSGTERRDIDFTKEPLTEEQISNAIVRVTRDNRRVYFLTGHEEYDMSSDDNQGLSYFSKLLEDNNISSKPLMLGIEGVIPEDCDILIIAGTSNKLTEKENILITA